MSSLLSTEPSTKPFTPNEGVKAASNHLRGDLKAVFADTATREIPGEAAQLAKFHGAYQQDDRDQRIALRRAGQDKAWNFMVRVRLASGKATPSQWLALDALANEHQIPSLRLTTRQTIQFHGVLKEQMKPLIQRMHKALVHSIATCGDVNRNVMGPVNPEQSAVQELVYEDAKAWSDFTLPHSRAYHEIWLDEELVAGGEPEHEPLYGATYLPRKFKTGFAIPPSNNVDIFTQDLGFIAIIEHGQLLGYNVVVGGGMGMKHRDDDTFPRLADPLGFIQREHVNAIGQAVLTIQRDYGDRTDRKQARLKYTIDRRGLPWFKAEVEARSKITFAPERPYEFSTLQDPLGWHENVNGTWFYGLHILSGRVIDREGWPMKTALREVAELLEGTRGDFRITPSQNLTISGVEPELKPKIEAILTKHGLDKENKRSGIRLNAISCVALPTCGLALAESERVLPEIIEKFETVLEEAGLRDDAIGLRVTGCPNGCARPYLAEIAMVGRAPNKYALYLGGKYNGRRLNRLAAASVTIDETIQLLTPVIRRYAKERGPGETFGDWCEANVIPADATVHSVGTNPIAMPELAKV